MEIISDKVLFKGKLYNDGDWYIDYNSLDEYKNMLIGVENNGYVYEFTLCVSYDTESDLQYALAKGFNIMNEVFKLKEHKKYANEDLISSFNNDKMFTGKLEYGNYSLEVNVKRETDYCL